MNLLQSEINAVPGQRADKNLRPEGWVGDGSAFFVIKNETARENRYKVRLECDQPFWRDEWYQLVEATVPGQEPAGGRAAAGGTKSQTLMVTITSGGSRTVNIQFQVPKIPASRAGMYRFRVIIEATVSDSRVGGEKPVVTERPGVLIVRPFYAWEVRFQPEEKRVGVLRRKASYEMIVTNKGNDWLYLDLKATRSQAMLVSIPTGRIAVPPPESDDRESIRSVPIVAESKLRTIRGERVSNPLALSVMRHDAPSVPSLPEEALMGGSANLGATVLGQETTDAKPPEVPPTITYCPPIPASFSGFIKALVDNAKQLIALTAGIVIFFTMARYAYERLAVKLIDVKVSSPTNGVLPADRVIEIYGTKFLDGSVAEVYGGDRDKPGEKLFTAELKISEKNKSRSAPINASGAAKVATDTTNFAIEVGEDVKVAFITKIVVRRKFWLPLPGLAEVDLKKNLPIQVNAAAAQTKASLEPGTYTASIPGAFAIKGEGFGPAGSVSIGGATVPGDQVTWTEKTVLIKVSGAETFATAPGPQDIRLKLASGQMLAAGTLELKAAPVAEGGVPGLPSGMPDPTTGGGTAEVQPGGSGGGAGGGSAVAGGGQSGGAAVAEPIPGYGTLLTALEAGGGYETITEPDASQPAEARYLWLIGRAIAGESGDEILASAPEEPRDGTLAAALRSLLNAQIAGDKDMYIAAVKAMEKVPQSDRIALPWILLRKYGKDKSIFKDGRKAAKMPAERQLLAGG